MENTMRRILVLALLAAPLAATAADHCKYQAPRSLKADLAGVRGVQVEVNSFDLHLTGSDSASDLQANGQACASDQSQLDHLQVTSRREGDQLIVTLGSGSGWSSFSLFGSSYSDLKVNIQLPASMPVTVEVGSGDADVGGLRQLASHAGSGDLHVHGISGKFSTSVGSGDVEAHDIGSLELSSAGSGDFKGEDIRGDAHVGSVGSGDVALRRVGGSVHVGTLGSGDLTVHDVQGDFSVGAKGSGDVDYGGVKGKVDVPHDDD
jgi:hypothetical protein